MKDEHDGNWVPPKENKGDEGRPSFSLRDYPKWNYAPWGTEVEYEGFRASFPPRGGGRITGQINNAVRFKSGDLLFNVLPGNVCYHFSRETKRFTYVFEFDWGPGTMLWSVMPDRAGNVYCTLSGMRTPGPVVDTAFGNWGAIIMVNPRKRLVRKIAESGTIRDPYGLQLMPDNKLLVADFNGFDDPGLVYTVDIVTGSIRVIHETGKLADPTTAFVDDDGVLWIANGNQEEQDGEVLAIEGGKRRVVFPKGGPMSGALLGVCPTSDPEYLVATKNEWDERTNAKLLLIEKKTGKAEILLNASQDEPQFYSNISSTVGSTLWVAECCNKELIEFDLKSRKVVNRYDLSPLMYGHRGMRSSFDSVSGVYAIP